MLALLETRVRDRIESIQVTERTVKVAWPEQASWTLDYTYGRFYAATYGRPGFRVDGVAVDPRLMGCELRDGSTFEFPALGARATLRRQLSIPPSTLPCPRCAAEIAPRQILYGYPEAWVTLAVSRGLVSVGGCVVEGGEPSLSCPACQATFDSDRDVLLPSLHEVHADFLREADARRGQLVVEVTGRGEKVTLDFPDDEELIVGSAGCHLLLSDPAVGSKHARIVRTIDRGEYWVADLASGTGTFVNGARIKLATRFAAGDAIAIGPFVLRISHRPRLRSVP